MNPYVNTPDFLRHLSKSLDDFFLTPVKIVGKRPIYKIIREYVKCQYRLNDSLAHFNAQELQALKKINRQVKVISEDKCNYYDTTQYGLLKRIYSCSLNAIYFGRFASSGSLGIELSKEIDKQIEIREKALLSA